jgi:cell division protease FtsH
MPQDNKPSKLSGGSAAALIVISLVFSLLIVLLPLIGKLNTTSYSGFTDLLDQGKIKRVTLRGDAITAELEAPLPNGTTVISTQRVPSDFAAIMAAHHVDITAEAEGGLFSTFVGWLLPPLIFVGIWVLFMRLAGPTGGLGTGVMSVGKSKAKLFVETEVSVKFDDVAGVDEAKAELREVVDFLRNPEAYGRLGAHVARGVMLVGPPGTGKTLLARALAGEAGVPFYSTNGSEFVEMFVGVGAARIRDLFEQARRSAPCIIFIDELDALGRSRAASPFPGGQDEKEQTLNQLLAEMDGFDRSAAVIILAATNRPEILDQALLRAGRFDRQVLVDRPDRKGRADILRIHLAKTTVAKSVDPLEIAALTPGFTGADLANLANEAAIVATRRGGESVTKEDFVAAIERIVGGIEKRSRLLIPKERRIVAHHEMGHALVAQATPGADPVQKVSIIPRGIGALGYTMQRPADDRFLQSRDELMAKMTVLLGGRAAEALIFGDISTGASDDLARATDIARGMVQRFGMDPALGPVAYDTEQGAFLQQPGSYWRPRLCSDETACRIDEAIHDLMKKALDRATAILSANRSALETGAELLLEHETLEADQLPKLLVLENNAA